MKFKKCRFIACVVLESKNSYCNISRNHYVTLNFRIIPISIYITILAILLSCKKLVDVDPPITAQTSENIYSNDATAISVLNGVYTSLASNGPLKAQTLNSISVVAGLAADELTLYGGAGNSNVNLVNYYQNLLSPGQSTAASITIWSNLYANIYTANLALERLDVSIGLTPSVKQQLRGEAMFLRAFFYFYLVNLYGDAVLTTTSDYRNNATLLRVPSENIYSQIIKDLKEAQTLLSENYVGSDGRSSSIERVRPNKWAATALLARVYLFIGNWADSESQATVVIDKKDLYDTVSVDSVFLKNSRESIWQLQPVLPGWNTEDARVFILPLTGPTTNLTEGGYPVYISDQWLNNFEQNDKRKTLWINYVVVNGAKFYFPFKYKSAHVNDPVAEYLTVFRLSELYLIRAEARAQQNNAGDAQSDLNIIRSRAGLGNIIAQEKSILLSAILQERRIELFSEWGHRWMDLKRTRKIDEVMTSAATTKGATWSTNWKWWPIPAYDIIQNPNLVQNPGLLSILNEDVNSK